MHGPRMMRCVRIMEARQTTRCIRRPLCSTTIHLLRRRSAFRAESLSRGVHVFTFHSPQHSSTNTSRCLTRDRYCIRLLHPTPTAMAAARPLPIARASLLASLKKVIATADLSATTSRTVRVALEREYDMAEGGLMEWKRELSELIDQVLEDEVDRRERDEQKQKQQKRKGNGTGVKQQQTKKKAETDETEHANGDGDDNGVDEAEADEDEADDEDEWESEPSPDEDEDEEEDESDEEYGTRKTKSRASATKGRKTTAAKPGRGRTAKRGAKRSTATTRKRRRAASDSEESSDASTPDDEEVDGGENAATSATGRLQRLKQLAKVSGVSLVRPVNVNKLSTDKAVAHIEQLFDDRDIDHSSRALTKAGIERARLARELSELGGDGEEMVGKRRSVRERKAVKYQSDDESGDDEEDILSVLKDFGYREDQIMQDGQTKRLQAEREQKKKEKEQQEQAKREAGEVEVGQKPAEGVDAGANDEAVVADEDEEVEEVDAEADGKQNGDAQDNDEVDNAAEADDGVAAVEDVEVVEEEEEGEGEGEGDGDNQQQPVEEDEDEWEEEEEEEADDKPNPAAKSAKQAKVAAGKRKKRVSDSEEDDEDVSNFVPSDEED